MRTLDRRCRFWCPRSGLRPDGLAPTSAGGRSSGSMRIALSSPLRLRPLAAASTSRYLPARPNRKLSPAGPGVYQRLGRAATVSNSPLVRFRSASATSSSSKSLLALEGLVVSPEGIELWVARSAKHLMACAFWYQVSAGEHVAGGQRVRWSPRASLTIAPGCGDIVETGRTLLEARG